MSIEEDPEDKLWNAYLTTISSPLRNNYDEKWEEDTYWKAVETFKVQSKEIGFEDPFELLGQFGLTSYEIIRDKLKAGPPPCHRQGWKSPLIGEKVDVLAVVESLHHSCGPKFEEKNVLLFSIFGPHGKDCILFSRDVKSK